MFFKRKIIIPPFFILDEIFGKDAINALRKIILTKGVGKNKLVQIDFTKTIEANESDFVVFRAQVEKAAVQKKTQFWTNTKEIENKRIKKHVQQLTTRGTTRNIFHERIVSTTDFKINQRVDTKTIDSVVSELKKVGIKEYYSLFYDILTELIGNATEHGINNQDINWWLHKEIDFNTKEMKFTFVDMGLGIVKSYSSAGILPFKYRLINPANVIIDALKGKLGSSTRDDNRGRGLPLINKSIENEFISNFSLLTNKVYIRYMDGKYISKKIPNFVGTYYSWSININNFEKWKSIQ